MSFQEQRSAISICNKALGRIHQQPLSGSLTDPANQNKLAGRECERWYKPTVRLLLEKHHWGLATKRTPLVPHLTGLHSEWPLAYAAPSDMAFPVAVDPWTNAHPIAYYVGIGFILARMHNQPLFSYEKGVIYSHTAANSLEYVSFDITEQEFTEEFEELVVIFLSAQLALSIAKDRDMYRDYKNEGATAMNQAIAHSLNVQQPRYGDFISEGEWARGGAAQNLLDGWRY